MSEIINALMTNLATNGVQLGLTTTAEIEETLKKGYYVSNNEQMKRNLTLASVQMLMAHQVPVVERSQKRLDYSDTQKNWLLSLNIQGATEAMLNKK